MVATSVAMLPLMVAWWLMRPSWCGAGPLRPGGSHHESNHGEQYKNFWAKVIQYIKIHFVKPVTGGGSSDPTCN